MNDWSAVDRIAAAANAEIGEMTSAERDEFLAEITATPAQTLRQTLQEQSDAIYLKNTTQKATEYCGRIRIS